LEAQSSARWRAASTSTGEDDRAGRFTGRAPPSISLGPSVARSPARLPASAPTALRRSRSVRSGGVRAVEISATMLRDWIAIEVGWRRAWDASADRR
jgi:hypothetical protein